MGLLILGLLIWYDAHLFKRFVPRLRAKLGDKGKGLVALALVLAIILMVIGYRSTGGPVWWGATAATKGINNLLVLAGFYLFATAGAKGAVAARMHHPQLIGFSLWAVGHLLVNGSLGGVVLFAGLLLWAVAEILLLNRVEAGWRPQPKPIHAGREVGILIITLVVYGVVAVIHGKIGPNPFGG